jgi:hypothetical protein
MEDDGPRADAASMSYRPDRILADGEHRAPAICT